MYVHKKWFNEYGAFINRPEGIPHSLNIIQVSTQGYMRLNISPASPLL
jgi:hypothetical protein